ncbi:BLUF domain-containing protein [Sphingomonas jatrophae]|uniref:Sensors of blue-light using FAD n=1 Tax=Sphingomonas jatrophae TaxID=1166337 RepID=A0A1I6JYE0_9SPHN|nr:BLUF domain-containing protein [Sphingomonas jatrophae]SFR83550.1 Sensors of blue-light using FAD [Sphingomonas jatrophae]
MLQLTYISNVVPGLSHDALEQILAASRSRNLAAGITGLLVHDGSRFLQALEGKCDAVQAIYASIKRDPRHWRVGVLSMRSVPRRQFGLWSMASQLAPAQRTGEDVFAMMERLTRPIASSIARMHLREVGTAPLAA